MKREPIREGAICRPEGPVLSTPERGDDDAGTRVQRLVRENREALLRYLSRLGVPAAEVDDVAQEVFLVASAKLPSVADAGERGFVFATAARVASNARRARLRRRRAYESYVHVPWSAPPTPEELADERSARAWLDAALDEMPVDLRGVFVLSELEELSVYEVAARADLPIGTAASRLRRAREAFRQCVLRARQGNRPEAARSPRVAAAADTGSVAAHIHSWWVTDGEADALAALLAVHRARYPDACVMPSAVKGTAMAKMRLRQGMGEGQPPDTFQATGGYDLLRWVKPELGQSDGARLHSLEHLYESEGWTSGLGAGFVADVDALVRHGGEAFGVPLDIHRTNTLVFHRALLEEHGITPPSTLTELLEAARALKKRGVVPLSVGTRAPWMLTLLAFENLLVAVAGPEFYRSFFTGRGHPAAPEIREALGQLRELLALATPDASELTWDEAATRVGDGTAAMTIGGDWVNGFLQRRGLRPALDFDATPTPGTRHVFVYSSDTFALPARARHLTEAYDLLRVMGSLDGQIAFSRVKGSLPARRDADLSSFDPLVRRAREDFEASVRIPTLTSLVPTAFSTVLDAALAAFATDGDATSVMTTLRKHYPMLEPRAR